MEADDLPALLRRTSLLFCMNYARRKRLAWCVAQTVVLAQATGLRRRSGAGEH